MGDATAVTVTAPPASTPRSLRSSSPWQVCVPVTPDMHAAVDRYLADKGAEYLDSLLALVAGVEFPHPAAPAVR